MVGTLNKTQITNILASQVVGRIGCCGSGKPYIVPVTYVFDGHYIYGQSLEGKKADILRRHPDVCFEVDVMSSMQHWQSVLVFGKFEELKGEEAEKARTILFDRVMTLMTSSTVHRHGHKTNGDNPVDDSNRIKPIMYRIKIEEMTGRFENLQKQ